jgi:hypothetical protein
MTVDLHEARTDFKGVAALAAGASSKITAGIVARSSQNRPPSAQAH